MNLNMEKKMHIFIAFSMILFAIFLLPENRASAIGGGLVNKTTMHYQWKNPITGEVVTRPSTNAPIYLTFNSGSAQANLYGTNKKFWEEYHMNEFLWYSPVPPEQLVESNADYDRYQILENKQTVWGSKYKPESVRAWYTNRNFTYNLKNGRHDLIDGSINGYKGNGSGTTKITTAYSKGGVTYNYIGKNFEWRYLGYSTDGMIVPNPFFPPDFPVAANWHPNQQLWIWEPWNNAYTNWDEDAKRGQYDLNPSRKEKWIADLFFDRNPKFLLPAQNGETMEQRKMRSAKYWRDAMLIKSNPEWSTGVVQMYHNGLAPSVDGLWHMVFTMKTPDKPNLRITSFRVIDTETNKVIGHVYRNGTYSTNLNVVTEIDDSVMLKAGKQYKLVADVKNMPVKNQGKDTTHKPLGLDFHIAYDDDVNLINEYSESHYVDKNDAEAGAPKNNDEKIPYNKVVSFNKNLAGNEWTFTVPDKTVAKDEIKLRVEIPVAHYIAGENTITEDDFAEIVLPIEKEDIGTLTTANLLKEGQFVDEVEPETVYDLQFFVNKPWGETPVGDPANLAKNPYASLQVVVTNNLGSKVYTATAKETLHGGKTVMLEIKGVKTGTAPWLEAEWQIRQIHRDIAQSTLLYNDGPFKQRWESEINISVQNFEIEPQVIHRGKNEPAGAEELNVCYQVMNANPQGRSKTMDVIITNLSSGQQWKYRKTVIANKSQTICDSLGVVNLQFGDNKFSVEVNPVQSGGKREWYEYLKNGQNPYKDNIAYQAIRVDQSMDEQYCETIHTRNNWTQVYTKSLYYQYWERDPIYDCDDDGCYFVGWSEPYPVDDLISTEYESVGHYETYDITKAKFKSRDYDGDILGGKGKIRAGYGFELEIDVKYETNVLRDSPKPWNTGRVGYRLDVYPPITPVSMPEALYIEMPYTDKTGEPMRYKLEIIKKSGGWDDMTLTFALPYRDAFGKETNRRIYFNETASNGVYSIRVDTEGFYGYSNKPAVPYLLCDTANLAIEVLGSNADDIKSHVTQ